MGFFPSNMILQFAIFIVFITSKCLLLGAKTPRLSITIDKEALISFKSGLRVETHDPLLSWDQTLSPCNWTGVRCNKVGTRVVELHLVGLGLKGSISPQIGNLSYLRSLQLQNNHLMGTFPNQLTTLFRLRVLNMSFNNIEGVIPPNISSCMELEILDLERNKISGRVPNELSYLTKLKVLNLGKNLLLGSIPPSLANLSSLIRLRLGTNGLDGLIPEDLSRLQKLKQLDLTINNLTGTVPPSIYNMSMLLYLNLASNGLWGILPSNVGDTLPNLLAFEFCLNKFSGTIPITLHNLTRIHLIRMASNLLHGTVPPGIGNLPELQYYNIGFNRIVGFGDNGLDFLTSLTNCSRLSHLAVDENLLEGVIPESIGNHSKVFSKLYMGGNHIHGRIPASIGRLSGLTLLNLSYNSISYDIPQEICHLEELMILELAANKLSGKIPTSIGNLKNLIQIDLSGNKLEGTIPTSSENFKKMLSLDFSSNKLSGSIPKGILNLPSLSTHLNLSNNLLTGPLPQEIGTLNCVIAVDLSNNGLSETIPNSIGNCKSLEKLLMARNMFTGPIPDTLSELKGLETLDISSNKLSGSIPDSLQKLQGLQLLNLSFNDLDGKVPVGGVFTNLSKIHLEGNPKLCFHFACEKGRDHRKRLIWVCVIIITIIASCSIIGLVFYLRKRKPKVTASYNSSNSFERQHRMVSYDQLRIATENFNLENFIGNGSFGSVYKGYLEEGKAVAIKVLNVDVTGCWKSFLAECAALRNVRHRNLVKLITSCSSIDFKNKNFLALVYEFMTNGSLDDWITGKRSHANGQGLNVVDRLNVANDVACVLDYLHNENGAQVVVHCDLKPSNILLDGDMTAKVGDFGLANLLIDSAADQTSITSTNALKGSIGYIPPEYGMGQKPSTTGDVYSFGITLLELFTGKSPTHESFTGDLSLKKWVQMAFATNVDQVLDPGLMLANCSLSCDAQSISSEAQMDCSIAVLGVGLACTADSPDGRISMRDALWKLKCIRENLIMPGK